MSKPYQGTSVNWAKSQTAIVKLLNSKGIFETRFTNLSDKFALEFRITDNKKMLFKVGIASGIGVRILVPFVGSTDENKRERELNQLHRVLFYHIKAKFVAIESGVTEFMEEFMPHLVIMDSKGNNTTLGQAILPQYKKNLEEGKGNDFKLLN
jgi:hypothetical protein